jgi:hypothetical protein
MTDRTRPQAMTRDTTQTTSNPSVSPTKFKRRGAQPIADLIAGVLSPAARKRGFATIDLFSYWPDIVGSAFADHTQPERLNWPKKLDNGGEAAFEPATLTVRCEGSRALLFQYEVPSIIERINAIFGFRAISKIRIVQMPIVRYGVVPPPPITPLGEHEERKLSAEIAGVEDEALRDALLKLGRAVRAGRPKV